MRPDERPQSCGIAWRVDDVDAYAGRVTAAGGAIHRAPENIPDMGSSAIASIGTARRLSSFEGRASRGLRRRSQGHPATSAGTNCMPVTVDAPLPSIRVSLAGPGRKAWTWVRWVPIKPLPQVVHRSAA